jgi:hypothetical protein
MTRDLKHQKLAELADKAIKVLKKLPQPVVRVSGPLTSGGLGYEKNLHRFILAQQLLQSEGYTVFDYYGDGYDERQILALELPWEEVMEYYHKPIMATKLIGKVFMMPLWETSHGASWEHAYAVSLGLVIEYLSENWLLRT